MEWLFKEIRELAVEIINYEEKEMIQLTDEETKSYETQRHLNYSIKIEIIVITPESLEELLIVFAM